MMTFLLGWYSDTDLYIRPLTMVIAEIPVIVCIDCSQLNFRSSGLNEKGNVSRRPIR